MWSSNDGHGTKKKKKKNHPPAVSLIHCSHLPFYIIATIISSKPWMTRNKLSKMPLSCINLFAKWRVPHATVLACDDNDEDAKDNTKAATPTHSNRIHQFLPFPSTKESEQMANGNVDWNSLAVCAISRALNFAPNRGCHRRQSSA